MEQSLILSVVLPNYNHAHLLARAVQALLAQESPPDEIIIVDDGSTDNSRALIDQILDRSRTVRVLLNETNQGAIPALNRGLDAAMGHYVYLAAADDWVLPGFFKLAIDALNTNPACGLFCGETVLVDGASNRPVAVRPPVRPTYSSRFVSAVQTAKVLKHCDNWILTSSSVFRREFVVAAGGLDQNFGPFADGIMARKIALRHGFFFAPQVVACWAVFPDSYSRRTALSLDQARHFLDFIPTRLAQDPVFPRWYPAVFASRWRFATSRLALETNPADHSLVTAMGARSILDRVVLRTMWSMPSRRLARLTTLAWLWLRLRPTSLLGLARTALAGRMRRFRRGTQMIALGREGGTPE